MLHLNAGVHFEEEELALGRVQKLHGARPLVGGGAGDAHRRFAEPGAHGVVNGGRGRFLDHFLKAPLHRALPFAKVHRALAVAEHLHLDVADVGEVPLHVNAPVAEVALGLGSGDAQGAVEFVGLANDVHALAAAAGGGLDHERKAEVGCGLGEAGIGRRELH